MLRKTLKISPAVLALALFALSLGFTFMPLEAQKIATGAFDAEASTCTCPDWDGCTCKTLK